LEAFCIYYASDSDVVPNCGSWGRKNLLL
jgi:hypothetical protein